MKQVLLDLQTFGQENGVAAFEAWFSFGDNATWACHLKGRSAY
jgi:hypothetical protein